MKTTLRIGALALAVSLLPRPWPIMIVVTVMAIGTTTGKNAATVTGIATMPIAIAIIITTDIIMVGAGRTSTVRSSRSTSARTDQRLPRALGLKEAEGSFLR